MAPVLPSTEGGCGGRARSQASTASPTRGVDGFGERRRRLVHWDIEPADAPLISLATLVAGVADLRAGRLLIVVLPANAPHPQSPDFIIPQSGKHPYHHNRTHQFNGVPHPIEWSPFIGRAHVPNVVRGQLERSA